MSRQRLARLAGWIAVALLLYPYGDARQDGAATAARRPRAQRWLGPAASLAASVTWIRFDLALRDGRPERAYVLAEEALALAPRAPEGWSTLARHLIFDRASLEAEPDPGRRRRWIQAGLAVFERGERAAADPGQLAYQRGTLLAAYVAEIAPAIGWPGGTRQALRDAIGALERAHGLGFERAEELLPGARAALAGLTDG